MKRYILTIDEGTTSLRAVLFDVKKNKFKKFERAFIKTTYPQSTWVEQDANEIWSKVVSCLKIICNKIKPEDIYGLGIANQRETIVAWDKLTGKPLSNAIIWKCRRTVDYCKQLLSKPIAKTIKEKTGLIVNSYFSATKIKWLLDNNTNVQQALKENRLCIGTIETYLVYRLTNNQVFVTDVTNASRTLLFNIKTLEWDKDLLKYFNIPREILAQPIDNDAIVGQTMILGKPITIAGLIGDQQSSLLGQGCYHPGDFKNTYGTGCFMLANTGSEIVESKHNLLTTIASRINGKTSYALEGSIFSGGSIINKIIEAKVAPTHRKLTKLACKCKQTNLYLIPAYNGLGAPYWLMDGEADFINKTSMTQECEIAKSCWEAIAFRNYDVYEALSNDLTNLATYMCVDGGLSKNRYLMQLQSNLIQKPISIINLESTCFGAVICTGLATKAFNSIENIKFKPIKTFNPNKQQNEIQNKIAGWKQAIKTYIERHK